MSCKPSCLCISGLFECQDPSVGSRNVSLEEFKGQIRKDNVSDYSTQLTVAWQPKNMGNKNFKDQR